MAHCSPRTLFPLTLLLYKGAPRLYPINLEILYAIVYFAVDLSLTLSLSFFLLLTLSLFRHGEEASIAGRPMTPIWYQSGSTIRGCNLRVLLLFSTPQVLLKHRRPWLSTGSLQGAIARAPRHRSSEAPHRKSSSREHHQNAGPAPQPRKPGGGPQLLRAAIAGGRLTLSTRLRAAEVAEGEATRLWAE